MLAGERRATRAQMRSELERDGFDVVAVVADADEAIEAARELRPQLCVLDIDMPGGGILAADRISVELPETRIAVIAGEPTRGQLREVILAGADGYLPATTSPDRLKAALNGLINGEAALTPAMTGELVREYRQFVPREAEEGVVLPAPVSENQPLMPRSRVRYLPRLVRHYRHRRQSGMRIGSAWASARARMDDYR
jgi:DNA-binding NarL/FixJ family response regulator